MGAVSAAKQPDRVKHGVEITGPAAGTILVESGTDFSSVSGLGVTATVKVSGDGLMPVEIAHRDAENSRDIDVVRVSPSLNDEPEIEPTGYFRLGPDERVVVRAAGTGGTGGVIYQASLFLWRD
jgi:hypothetical protein